MRRQEIVSRLRTGWMGREIRILEEADSTNLRAKAAAGEGADAGLVILAEQQTDGRGRRGRAWQSPAGENIYMTVLLRPDFEPEKAPMLTLLAACAAARAVKSPGKRQPQIKWPNDLIINGKKICGILTEMGMKGECTEYVIVGIGINCNQTDFPEELRNRATSLKCEYGCEVCREEIVARFLEEFESLYEEFEKRKSLEFIQDEYETLLVNEGREVCVLEPGKEWTGTAAGITETGELIVKKDSGEICEISSGEVSVRGVYGYV
nr:biotin--[acetyl-CoA-carboxylase] ligase [uncultured Sellimonas sp.]